MPPSTLALGAPDEEAFFGNGTETTLLLPNEDPPEEPPRPTEKPLPPPLLPVDAGTLLVLAAVVVVGVLTDCVITDWAVEVSSSTVDVVASVGSCCVVVSSAGTVLDDVPVSSDVVVDDWGVSSLSSGGVVVCGSSSSSTTGSGLALHVPLYQKYPLAWHALDVWQYWIPSAHVGGLGSE